DGCEGNQFLEDRRPGGGGRAADLTTAFVHRNRRARRRRRELRRQADAIVKRFDRGPADLEPDDLPAGTAALLFDQRRAADKRTRVDLPEAAESHFVRRVLLRFDQRLLAAIEIAFDEQ